MPAEITQSNERVAEIRFVCDSCGTIVGMRLMPKQQAEAHLNSTVLCENCREKSNFRRKP